MKDGGHMKRIGSAKTYIMNVWSKI